MRKTLNDMAGYLKDLIPPPSPVPYAIKPLFGQIGTEETVRDSVDAFRDFLIRLYDRLQAEGGKYEKRSDKPDKETHDHTSLPVTFPFLNCIKSILINVGYHGRLAEQGDRILLDNPQVLTTLFNAEGQLLRAKLTSPKLIEGLGFLKDCGLEFGSADRHGELPDLLKAEALTISCPADPRVPAGLKVMAMAQKELYVKGSDELFMRCDYRVLQPEAPDITAVLNDFLSPLPVKVQDLARQLHRYYLDAGLICKMEIRYLRVRFSYTYKNKELWMFSASLNHGCRIFIKAANTHRYTDVIETFPLLLQDKIAKGFGCDKKKYGEPCQGGCHGFRIPLDETVLDVSDEVRIWLDCELAFLR